MKENIKKDLRFELLERTLRCKRKTYAKLNVGQVVQADRDLEYISQPPGNGRAQKQTAKGGERLVIMMFTRSDNESARFSIYAKSLETGQPITCTVSDVLPCAFADTFELFR